MEIGGHSNRKGKWRMREVENIGITVGFIVRTHMVLAGVGEGAKEKASHGRVRSKEISETRH